MSEKLHGGMNKHNAHYIFVRKKTWNIAPNLLVATKRNRNTSKAKYREKGSHVGATSN